MKKIKLITEAFVKHDQYEWDRTRLEYYESCLVRFDKDSLEYEYIFDMINSLKRKNRHRAAFIEWFSGLSSS